MAPFDTVTTALTGAMGGTADITPGTLAAWAVTFREDTPSRTDALLTVGSDTYDGSVTATLPKDLAGGTYQLLIEGMTDEDYAKIRLRPGRRLRASLHLWWKDSPSGILGDLAQFTGLTDPRGAVTPDPPAHSTVADIRVDTLRRRAGERRYDVSASGREAVVARLSEHRVFGQCYASLTAAMLAVAEEAGIPLVTHGLDDARPGPEQPDFANTAPGPALEAMKTLADQARDAQQLYGLPVAVIRDGTLHVGKWTADAGGAGRLDTLRHLEDESAGVVAVERGQDKDRETGAGAPAPGSPTSRETVTVTSLGRPDIKPGDTVLLTLPPQDFPTVDPTSVPAALLTSLTGLLVGGTDPDVEPSRCLVGEVSHRLSRRQGFVTTFPATVLGAGDDGWDPASPAADKPAARSEPDRRAAADSAGSAAAAVQTVMRDVLGGVRERTRPRIGEVHDHPVTGVPRHTSDVWYADLAPDGLPVAAQRTSVGEEHHGELREVPYVTPFGWGHFGLVLPRYPGTRVLLVDAGGGPGDFVDVGTLWPRDAGPPAQAGDYWLVLPVGITQREHLPSGGGAAPDGPASHDLIDADGTRVLETTRFVVRVTDQPTDCTARPAPGADAPTGSVLIETKPSNGTGASIQLRDDGSVTITATSITFDTLGRGDISLRADNVAVTLSDTGKMDVS